MRQTSGDKALVALVAGDDRHGNFAIAEPPKGRLREEDFARVREDAAIRRRILYEGAAPARGKRY